MAKTQKYAEGTEVPISRSKEQIENELKRHGATGFLSGEHGGKAALIFELKGRRYRFDLTYPPLENFTWGKVNQYQERQRTPAQTQKAWEQEKARLWRGLVLLVKGKLEAIESGISSLEMEMQPYTVMTNNQTVGEWLEPQLEQMYQSGEMPPLLPGSASSQKYIEGR